LGNAAGTSAQPGTVDIPVVCPEPTAQLVPPEPIEQSCAEAQLSSNAVETTQPTSPADPDTGPAPASSGSGHIVNANEPTRGSNEPTRGSKSANEEGIPLSHYVASDFANLQSKDANIAFLREYLLHKTEANKGDLLLASSEAKCYYNERARFELDDDGVVWRKPDARHDPLRLLVPSTKRAEIIRLCHIIPSSGHPGVQRTRERLRNNFYWYRLTDSIHVHVLTCRTCSLHTKGKSRPSTPFKRYQVGTNGAGVRGGLDTNAGTAPQVLACYAKPDWTLHHGVSRCSKKVSEQPEISVRANAAY
jgi:hypothetical protein